MCVVGFAASSWDRKDFVVPLIWDFSLAAGFTLGFIMAKFLLDKFAFWVIALWLLGSNKAKKGKVSEAVLAKVLKLSESTWKFTYYGTVEACVLVAGYHEPWFWDVKEYLRGWPNQELKFFRIGSVILALHDASNVFLEAAKVFKYSGNEIGASILFGLFAVSWVVLRLVFYPFRVIRASSYHFVEHVPLTESYNILRYYVFNTLLLLLLVFHGYWWVLICSVIVRQLKNRGKVGEDIRSDSEDDN